ncbi:hypothetical protein B484DRAFT_424993 [Ochromonadaceae sp. CCMP2298]|nr:hypothetical protein B484DRAFT_424993 [Ochromonadaceae sp. CCMP2298]
MSCSVSKRLVNLLFLRTPSELTVALLQALRIILSQDHITAGLRVKKASPAALFDFGGRGAGLRSHLTTFPFDREYQFCTWVRVEDFGGGGADKAFSADPSVQHVFTWRSAHKGLDLFIDDRCLAVGIARSGGLEVRRFAEVPLQRGVWYHITIRHAKPRLSLFSSDELSIHIEETLVYEENVRFPAPSSTPCPDASFSFGANFNGQMAPLYLFSESLPPAAIRMIAGLDAGRPIEGVDCGLNPPVVDLLPHITLERKVPILSRVGMAYHPSRCMRGHALDIHSGRHCLIGTIP